MYRSDVYKPELKLFLGLIEMYFTVPIVYHNDVFKIRVESLWGLIECTLSSSTLLPIHGDTKGQVISFFRSLY